MFLRTRQLMKHLFRITFTFYAPLVNVLFSPLFVLSAFQLETRAISHISVLLLLIQRCCTQPVELFSLQSLFATRHARLSYVNYDVFGRGYGNFISTCLINVLLLAQTLLSLLPSIYALTKSRLCSRLIMRPLFLFSHARAGPLLQLLLHASPLQL